MVLNHKRFFLTLLTGLFVLSVAGCVDSSPSTSLRATLPVQADLIFQ